MTAKSITTVSVFEQTTAATLEELHQRTGIPKIQLMEQIFAQVQKQMDLMQADRRLLFMADFYNKDGGRTPKTIIRLSDAFTSGSLSGLDVPKPVKEFYRKMQEKEDKELRGEK